jgi:glycosyltransferase involved in cell wall biosynthesis
VSATLVVSATPEEVPNTSGRVKARSLRVLTLTPFFPSVEDPGQGGFIAEPLAIMESVGISSEVIAARPFYRSVRTAESPTATWERFFSIPGNAGLAAAGRFLAARILRTILNKHREMPFDVIHAHAALPCGHAAEILAHRLSIPFVVTVHGLDAFFTRQAGTVMGTWCGRLAEKVYRSASAVICISEKVRDQLISKTPANVTVVYNGIDTEKFFPQKGLAASPSILSVGNLIPVKGHALLLRAFASVLRDVPDCSLEIIGDGPERKKLGHLAVELGIANSIHFHGRQSRDYVAEAMRRCTVFALPSTYEGLGCVYLEAMACAKPAIGCRGQGVEEVIEHGKTGMLVTAENKKELTNAMLTLLRDKELRRSMGTNARALILNRFTLSHQAQQLAEVYRRCLR